jgi:hypothetical protein
MSYDSELAATSSSKDPIVMKVMVDYQHYEKLLEAEKFQNKYNDKVIRNMVHKTDVLDTKAETSSKEDQVPSSETPDEKEIQTGSGVTAYDEKTELSSLVRSAIKEEFSNLFKEHLSAIANVNKEQTGRGVGDLKPPKVETAYVTDHEPLPGTSVNEKSIDKLITEVDVAQLLSKIPSSCQESAKTLISFFLENPNGVSWDDNGIITVDDVTIPNSNINEILPQLYAKTPKSNLPGYVTLVTYIFTSGLQHLIKAKKFQHFSRKRPLNKESLPVEDVDFRKFSHNSHWYYIGDN